MFSSLVLLDFLAMKDVSGYLQGRVDESSSDEAMADLWRSARDLYSKKLWHQLTDVLDQLVASKEVAGKDGKLVELYENVISDFETK